MYDAGTVTKNGVQVPVKVDDDGRWYASVGDDNLFAPTKNDLIKQIDKATRKVSQKVSIPFTSVTFRHNLQTDKITRTVRRGHATGIHSGNSNILFQWDDNGERGQLDRWGGRQSDKFVPLTTEEADEYARLYVAQIKASNALAVWERDHKIDLRVEVKNALDKSAGADEE